MANNTAAHRHVAAGRHCCRQDRGQADAERRDDRHVHADGLERRTRHGPQRRHPRRRRPAGLTVVSMTPSQGSYSGAERRLDRRHHRSGGQATATIQALVVGSAPMTNTATVSAVDEPQSSIANDSASATVTPPHADLAITKTVGESSARHGRRRLLHDHRHQQRRRRRHRRHGYGRPAARPDFGSAVAGQGAFDELDGNVDRRRARQRGQCHADAQHHRGRRRRLHQHGDGHGRPVRPGPGQQHRLRVALDAVADIAVTKVADNPAPTVGHDVTFTVTATNDGPDDATQLVVHDAAAGRADLRLRRRRAAAHTTRTPATGRSAASPGKTASR